MITLGTAIAHIQTTECPYWYLEKREAYGAFRAYDSWMGAGDKGEELPEDLEQGILRLQAMIEQYKGVDNVVFRLSVKKSKSAPKNTASGNLIFRPDDVNSAPVDNPEAQGVGSISAMGMPSLMEMMTYLKSHEDDIRVEKQQLFQTNMQSILEVNSLKDQLRQKEMDLQAGIQKKEFELFKLEQNLKQQKERFEDQKQRWDQEKKDWDEEKDELEKRLNKRSTATIKALEKFAPRILGMDSDDSLSGVGEEASPQEQVINRIANRLYQDDLDLRVLLSVEKAVIQYTEKIKEDLRKSDAELDSEQEGNE